MKPQLWIQILGQTIAIALSSHSILMAQIVPDETLLEGEKTRVIGDLNTQIDGGAVRGSNLFHSFEQFSIPTGGSAFFNNSDAIANIISRVTGSDVSTIDGLIRANGNANVFLINPNGIVFGVNASLDIGGSFVASTANSVVFDNGFAFSATDPQAPPLLTVNVPVGLQFGSNPGAIQLQGASLQVPDGRTLTLAGGAIAIDGGELLAPGGRIELVSIANLGEIGLTQQGQEWRLFVPEGLTRADVAIVNDAIVAVDAGGGGSIAITARNLIGNGLGTRVRSGIAKGLGTVGARSGDIDINATETVNLDEMVIANRVESGGTGNAGDVNIATGTLSLTNGAVINTGTFGRGDAGNITITATDSVSFDGMGNRLFPSGVVSSVFAGAIGQGGNISINTGSLYLTNGAEVFTTTFGRGDAGNITITATDSVSFDGFGSDRFSSGAFSSVGSAIEGQGQGRGGDIDINTGSLSLTNGAAVSAGTFSRGDAGNITITARDSVSMDGRGSRFPSGVVSAVFAGAIGRGGDININTGSLSLTNGAEVFASTISRGDAGNITITATDSVSFDGTSGNGFSSGAFSSVGFAAEGQGQGQGGRIRVNTDLFSIANGAVLSVSSQGQGDAGNIEVTARQLRLDRKGSIQAQTASGQGGNIRLQVGDLLLLRRESFISTTAGTEGAGGDGGNIIFNGNFIVTIPNENSDISANAFTGNGGKIDITAQRIFGIQSRSQPTTFSDITARSEFGISGTITLNTPNLDPSRDLATLPTGIVNPNVLIANSCITRSSRQGSFTIAGSGGLAALPDDPASSSFPTYELVPDATRSQTIQQASDAIVESDGIYRLSDGKVVLGRACR